MLGKDHRYNVEFDFLKRVKKLVRTYYFWQKRKINFFLRIVLMCVAITRGTPWHVAIHIKMNYIKLG